jgi:2,4'-dihydroxyacetophenone dioxygenase
MRTSWLRHAGTLGLFPLLDAFGVSHCLCSARRYLHSDLRGDTVTTNIKPQTPAGEAIAYRGKPLPNVLEDLVILDVLDLDSDERLWVPQAPDVAFRPLLLSVSHGYFVNLLRVRKTGVLSRHRHAGPVHATTLKGRWHYLEHSWWAEEGSYAFEPPGDIHTLVVPEGVDEMVTMFHVTGAYIYVDPDGIPVGVEDVFSKLEAAREHYESVGLGADFANQFIR